MFKKNIALILLGGTLLSGGTFAYTTNDVNTANYLANQDLIADQSTDPSMYRLDTFIERASVIGILLNMKGAPINGSCRGDFVDAQEDTVNDDWVCRIVETAADYGYINDMKNLPLYMRRVRPHDNVTNSEAVGILMKAFSNTGAWAGYTYYWDANFPNDGDAIGYKDAYNFPAQWQAVTMYNYIRQVLQSDLALRSNPLPNNYAQRGDVFDVAQEIQSS